MPKRKRKVKPLRIQIAERLLSEPKNDHPPDTPMSYDHETARTHPDWTQIERYNDEIGRKMPYARKETKVTVDLENADLLWSVKGQGQVMLSIKEFASDPEPLTLLRKDMVRDTTQPDGSMRRGLKFKPIPTYLFDKNNDPRTPTPPSIFGGSNQEYAITICCPLFKVERIERVERRDVKASSEEPASKKAPKGDEWAYGPSSLNDKEAELWMAIHSDVELVRFEDDSWTQNGTWFHPDFYEREYVTSTGTRYWDSLLAKRDDMGLFWLEGVQHVWKLTPQFKDVELYEFHMEKKIREHWEQSAQEKSVGERTM